MAAPVSDSITNHEEAVQRFARVVGKSAFRQRIYSELYSRKKSGRSAEQITEDLHLPASQVQQVRNVLADYANKGLIERAPSDEKSKGNGTRKCYRGYPHFQGLKDEVLKLAKNKTKREQLPTKRSPKVKLTTPTNRGANSTRAAPPRKKLRILYITATPSSQEHLRVDAEYKMVSEQIERSKNRDQIRVDLRLAADLQSILKGINDTRPQVVHFSGHADGHGLWLDDGKIDASVGGALPYKHLAQTMDSTDSRPIVVILNACETKAAVNHLLKVVAAVVTMGKSVTDLGAANFASQFYAALGAGQSLESAFKQARLLMEQASPADTGAANLTTKDGVDPKKLKLT